MNIEIERYSKALTEDGFVHVKSLMEGNDLGLLKLAIKSTQDNPSPFSNVFKSSDGGEFFMDFNNWRRLQLIEKVCRHPKIVDLVTVLAKTRECWLFHDHVLVKSGDALATPVHHDRPYFIFKGDLNLSVWMTADDVPRNSSIVFYKGTHRLNQLFTPKAFGSSDDIKGGDPTDFTVINQDTFKDYETVDFEMSAGDALIFFHKTVHRAKSHASEFPRRACSIRYLLDGASMTNKYVNATPPFDRMGVEVVEDGPVPEQHFPKLKG